MTTARSERIRPGLDDKILTAWNGLMIKGMARAGRKLEHRDLVLSARQAMDFVRTYLWHDGRLHATFREEQSRLNAYLDDYAFLAEGVLELLQADWKSSEFLFLGELADAMISHFEDNENGGFFFTSHDHEQLLHRPKSGADDAIPAANSAAVSVLYRLGVLMGDSGLIESARRTVDLFAAEIGKNPSVYASLTMAALDARKSSKTVVLRGSAEDLRKWTQALELHYRPDVWIYPIPDDVADLPASLAEKSAAPGKTIAYICSEFECSPPVESIEALQSAIS